MKKAFKRSLSLLLAITIIFGSAYVGLSEVDFGELFAVKAEAASESNLKFKLNDDGQSYSVDSCSYSASGSLTIPSTYNGLPVTSIGNTAFLWCENLTSVIIPDSVTSIRSSAFSTCSGLTSITVDSANIYYSSVDGVLFNKDKTELLCYPASKSSISYTFPNSVTSIGDDAFYNCKSLTSITIPDSVTSIGDDAFYNCESLTSITIPDSVTSIGASTFGSCDSLVSITIPDSVTSIGHHAFYGCTSLTSITIPDSVTSIDAHVFAWCRNLTSVTIPDSVTSIGEYAFYVCDSLTSITIPDSVTSISEYAFYGCDSLKSVVIGDSVTSIGGNSVTSIGNYAFYNCTALTSVTIGNSVTSIGNYAFNACSNLGSVTIGNSVTSIGDYAFENCTNLTSITIPDSVTSIGYDAFSACSSLTSVTIGNSVTSIGTGAFRDCTSLTSIIIPDSVTSIVGNAFSGCTKLTSITIPDSVTFIGDYAFYNTGYYNDSSNWENKVLYIGNHLIKAKDTVSGSYVIKDGTKTIANWAFCGCTNLTSVTIPDSVTSISFKAFLYCTSLTSVTIPDSVTSIIDWAFCGCTNLTSITIPDSVTSIGDYAFEDCTSLSSIIIPDSVTSIGEIAFYGCTSLASITFPDSVTSIGWKAFYGCTSLVSVTIPNSVTSISDYTFYNCTSLTSITIPDSVTSIGYNAFSTNNLKEVITPCNSYAREYFSDIGISENTFVLTHGSLSDWIVDKEATVTTEGSKYKECTECGETLETATIAKIPITPTPKAINALNGIQISWNSVAGATKYSVYRRNAGSSTWTAIGTVTSTSLVDKNVTAGKYYIYSVRAYNSEGAYSAYVSTKTKTIQYILTPTAIATNLANGLQIKWNSVTGATKYNVYRRVGGSSSWVLVGTTTGTSLVDKGVTNGKYYVYSIRAINGTGYSAFDAKKTDTIQPITAPTAKVAKKSNGVQVSWNSVSGATKYNVYRRLGGTSTWIYVGTTTSTTLLDKGVVKGKSYAYSIRAINGTGYSAYNSTKCAAIKYS